MKPPSQATKPTQDNMEVPNFTSSITFELGGYTWTRIVAEQKKAFPITMKHGRFWYRRVPRDHGFPTDRDERIANELVGLKFKQ